MNNETIALSQKGKKLIRNIARDWNGFYHGLYHDNNGGIPIVGLHILYTESVKARNFK